MNEKRDTIRLDKWLWQARFFKSRSIATGIVSAGKVRINGDLTTKPARGVGASDILTFHQQTDVRVVKIINCGNRRGPAPEAQALYDDMSPPKVHVPKNPKFEGKGRPTKKDRRDMLSHPREGPVFDLE